MAGFLINRKLWRVPTTSSTHLLLLKAVVVFVLCCLEPSRGAQGGGECSLGPVTVSNVTANSVILSWTSGSCTSASISSYSLETTHLAWLACLNSSSDSGAVKEYSVSYSQLVVSELSPWSSYLVELSALGSRGELVAKARLEFQTEMDVPDSRPVEDTSWQPLQRAITFKWEEAKEECSHQNGRSDGYQVELVGLDPWHIGIIQQDKTIQGTQFYAGKLQPYTSYILRVYSRNVGNLVNRQNYLELKARTLPDVALPPNNLTASAISERSVFLSWSPAYPRTGLIEKYEMRKGEFKNGSEQPHWISPITVNPSHHNACHDSVEKGKKDNIVVCYVEDNLRPATKYAFQVSTWILNVNETPPWSQVAMVTTDDATVSTQPISALEPSEVGGEDETTADTVDNLTLIIVLCVSAFLVILIVSGTALMYRRKINRLKTRLREEHRQSLNSTGLNISSLNSTRLDSSVYYQGGSVATQGTSYTTSPATWDIRTRRLPEPPPTRGPDMGYSEAHELTTLPTGYLDMSQRRSSEVSGVEGVDIDGYLRPTFPFVDSSTTRHSAAISCESQDSDYVSESSHPPPSAIPVASYGRTTVGFREKVSDERVRGLTADVNTNAQLNLLGCESERPGSSTSQRSRGSSCSPKRCSPSDPLVLSKSVDV